MPIAPNLNSAVSDKLPEVYKYFDKFLGDTDWIQSAYTVDYDKSEVHFHIRIIGGYKMTLADLNKINTDYVAVGWKRVERVSGELLRFVATKP